MRKIFPILLLVLASAVFADDRRYSMPLADSPALGPANAPLTLIEFIDYQ